MSKGAENSTGKKREGQSRDVLASQNRKVRNHDVFGICLSNQRRHQAVAGCLKVIRQIFPVGKESGSIQLCGELCDPRSLSYFTAFVVLYVVILRPAIPGWHQTFYKLRMTLNSGSSCLYLLSAVIIDIYGHAWFMGCWVSRGKGLCMLGKYTIN